MNPLRVAIVGIAGYAQSHYHSVRYCEEKGLCKLTAMVIRLEERDIIFEGNLQKHGVQIYRSFEELLDHGRDIVDLITLPIGIASHAPLSIKALEAGFHVICEKPAAGTYQEACQMMEAQKKTGLQLSIGFQLIYSPAVQRIKQYTLDKKLGALESGCGRVLWPRDSKYYARNKWAGKITVDGQKIYDSPIQNATAHYLNNLLYVAGPSMEETVTPYEIYGENYRAKDIESADTQYIRVTTPENVRICFTASHATDVVVDATLEWNYENGKIVWFAQPFGKTQVLQLKQHIWTIVDEWDNGEVNPNHQVFVDTIQAIHEQRAPLCHIGNSWQQVVCVNTSFESSQGVIPIPEEYTHRVENDNGSYNIVIKELLQWSEKVERERAGFYDVGAPWGKASETIRWKNKA